MPHNTESAGPRRLSGGVEIGIDIGGTFTDVVCRDSQGAIRLLKVPTSKADPSTAVFDALNVIKDEWGIEGRDIHRFAHGTTVGTNAVLEGKGARIGLLATDGFTDVLELGRQMRREIYDLVLKPQSPAFLAPGAFRKGIVERIGPDGQVLTPLDEASVRRAVDTLLSQGVEAIAVCYLFSFLNPDHEIRTREIIRERAPGIAVSLSCEVDPAFREYERTCVTAFDAYIKPLVGTYLRNMERRLGDAGIPAPLHVMQSRGGIFSSTSAGRRPVRLFLSGPAAGVIGALNVGRQSGSTELITVDIGGTSCDIAIVSGGEPLLRSEGEISGYPVRVPMIDVTAIGSGGGSIAWIDAAGTLKVGPESAGSDPGPACYGRGSTEATVTDASVVLGYVNPDYFAGGRLRLDPRLAEQAVRTRIAEPLGLTVVEAAMGIHSVLNAQMAEAIRVLSIGRGVDPRTYTLVPLGGGGGIHATALARDLGIERVCIPQSPGVLAAAGLLLAPTEQEVVSAFLRRLATLTAGELRAFAGRLDERCVAAMAEEGLDAGSTESLCFADVCYVGQSYSLELPVDLDHADPIGRIAAAYEEAYTKIYGYASGSPAQIVNLRVIRRSISDHKGLSRVVPTATKAVPGTRKVHLESFREAVPAAIYGRGDLETGAVLDGPAIVEQADTTTLIDAGWSCLVAADGSLLLTRETEH